MKTLLIYSCATEQEAQEKAAELDAADYRLDVFEKEVRFASADFRHTGGDESSQLGSFWIVVGTKAE